MSEPRKEGTAKRLRAALHDTAEKTVVREVLAPTPKTKGLHAIAIFEAIKGVAVLLAGLGLLALVHRDVQDVAEHFVRAVHLNPASHYPRIFIDAAADVTDSRLVGLAVAAGAYSVVRLVEAYGLWLGRAWAEWFAIVSGGLYLPVELYELARHPALVKALVLAGNAALVAYLIRARHRVAREVVERSKSA